MVWPVALLSGCAWSEQPTAATLLEASCRQAKQQAFVDSERIKSISGTLYFSTRERDLPISGGCWESCARLAIELSTANRPREVAVYYPDETARGANYRIESSPELADLRTGKITDFWGSSWDEPSEWASKPGWWTIAVTDAAKCGDNNWTQQDDGVVFLKHRVEGLGFACLRTGPLAPPTNYSSIFTLEQILEDIGQGCGLQELRYSIRSEAAIIGQISEFRLLCQAVAEGFRLERCPSSLTLSPVSELLGPLKTQE
jgi:hypothetical protein